MQCDLWRLWSPSALPDQVEILTSGHLGDPLHGEHVYNEWPWYNYA